MKNLTILTLFLLITQISFGQLDNVTKNKIKAYYFTAEELYNNKNYNKALDKLEQIEVLTKGLRLASVQNLKVKTLIKLENFKKAQQELEVLYSLNPSNDIFKDIASYSSKIDEGIEAEQLAIKKMFSEEVELDKIRKKMLASVVYNSRGLVKFGLCKVDGKYGVVDLKGNIIVPCIYSSEINADGYRRHRRGYLHNDNVFTMYRENYDKDGNDIYTKDGLQIRNVVEFETISKGSKVIEDLITVYRKKSVYIKSRGRNELKVRCSLYSISKKKYLIKDYEFINPEVTDNNMITASKTNNGNEYINISSYIKF